MSNPTGQAKKTIRELREARGWAQLDLAVRLRVARSNIPQWESGAVMPVARNRQRLANLFGYRVDQIAFGQYEERP